MSKFKTAYYYKTSQKVDGSDWHITFELSEAEKGIVHRIATIEDLEDLFCATGEYYSETIVVSEGSVEWDTEKAKYSIV